MFLFEVIAFVRAKFEGNEIFTRLNFTADGSMVKC